MNEAQRDFIRVLSCDSWISRYVALKNQDGVPSAFGISWNFYWFESWDMPLTTEVHLFGLMAWTCHLYLRCRVPIL